MAATFVEHVKKGKEFRTAADEQFAHARAKYKGKLDFSAYRQGHDPMFLGINGRRLSPGSWGLTVGAYRQD